MAIKLNQLLAAEKTKKNATNSEITATYHVLQKADSFTGMIREYTPTTDGGLQLPSESKKVQFKAVDLVGKAFDGLANVLDLLSTKNKGNTSASADIVLEDGTVIAEDVPVTTLLDAEKTLTDALAVVGKLPVLDVSANWNSVEGNTGLYRADTIKSNRLVTVERPQVVTQATEKHPAQVALVKENVLEGVWSTTALSGAMPADEIKALQAKIQTLLTAVRYAREAANNVEIQPQEVGKALFSYLAN